VCELWQTWKAGDHLLLAGQVEYAASAPLQPLIHGHRTLGVHSRLAIPPEARITEVMVACAR
jgi:hypothetical protein